MLCGSTMGTVGCAGETEEAIEKPSIPPIFSSVHILVGLLTVLEMYSWVGWRCHNPLATEGERNRSLGQRGEEYMLQLLCSANAEEWARTGNVTAVNIVFQRSLFIWRRRENCTWLVYHQAPGILFQPFLPAYLHPPSLRSGFQVKEKTQKINPLPLRKLIYGGPLMKPDNSCNIFMIRGRVPHSWGYRHRGTVKNGGTDV